MRRALFVVALGLVAALSGAAAAWAVWGAPGGGTSTVGTGVLNAPTNATASALSDTSSVAVGWTGAALTSGQPATGYYVVRVRNSDAATFPACGTTPASPTAVVGCNDSPVTDGSYRYRITALFASWTAVSTPSNTVIVVNDSTLPTVTVTSVSPTRNGNGYNNSSPVVVNLTASDVAGIESITYSVDSGASVTVTSSTAAVSVAGDGIHTITFSAKDNAGNTSVPANDIVRIDTIAPVAPSAPVLAASSDSGSSSSDRITNVTAPTFSGTAEAGSTVTLYSGATVVGSAVATGGTYTITASALTAGAKTMTVTATDIASNIGPASAGTAITVDSVAPAAPTAPTLTAGSDSGSSSSDRITNVTTPTFTGSAEAGSTVALYNGAAAVGTAIATGGAYSVDSSALTTGTKTMTVKATDVAGNVGPASSSTSITIDITAPGKPGTPTLNAANDTGRSNTDGITMMTTPTFTGTATAGTTLTLYDGAVVVGSVATATTSYSITSSTLSNAAHTITVKATDVAGNVSVASTAKAVTVDSIAPAAPSAPALSAASDTGKSSSDRITKTVAPVVTGTNESTAIVILSDGATPVGTRTTTGSTYSITSSTLSSGNHTLTATCTDVAGNQGPASSGTTITIDTTAPVAPSAPVLAAASDSGISSTDGRTKITTPTFTGTAEAGITVALFDGATATGAAVTATGGAYTAVTGTLATGSRTITARPTDVAGNVGPASTGTVVIIDTAAPTVTINQAAGQADPTTASPINFTAVFGESVYGLTGSGVTFTGTGLATTATIAGTGTTFTVSASGMTKTGTVIPKVAAGAAQDAAGNLNVASTTTDSTVMYTDSTAPVVAISSFAPGASQTATVSGTAGFGLGDGATVTVVLCTVNSFPCAAGNTKATLTPSVNTVTGAWSVTSGTLGTTASLFARATQTDLTGNIGQSPVAGPIAIA